MRRVVDRLSDTWGARDGAGRRLIGVLMGTKYGPRKPTNFCPKRGRQQKHLMGAEREKNKMTPSIERENRSCLSKGFVVSQSVVTRGDVDCGLGPTFPIRFVCRGWGASFGPCHSYLWREYFEKVKNLP